MANQSRNGAAPAGSRSLGLTVAGLLLAAIVAVSPLAPARADLRSGLENFERGNFEVAETQLRPLAEEGDPNAQYALGIMLLNGYIEDPDETAALTWLTRAAEQGYLQAQTELARMYRIGDGVEQDFDAMARWYRRAAEQGDVGAQLLLADSYAYGYGVPKDPVEAYMWYEIAIQYWGPLAVRARDVLGETMSAEEIALAVTRASAWLKEFGQ
jgi:TPR repeat protein